MTSCPHSTFMKQILSNLRNLFYGKCGTEINCSYNKLSRHQLITRITELEHELKQLSPDLKSSKSKSRRPFDVTKYEQRRIALKVAYIGWNYYGFSRIRSNNVPTVETELFKALQESNLISSPDDCNFSRGGRTDTNVSGLGQVVALDVRSNQLKTLQQNDAEISEHLPYLRMINSFLPDDIRVLAWAPVPSTFNARFDCISRTYKYFFKKDSLDLDKMIEAGSHLVGSHDFRNFCLIDASRNLPHYERDILSFDISHVEDDFYAVKIRGTGFLWHQIRYIMSILFLVGQKLESPKVVKDLLDINKVPARPGYPLASGKPLVLYDCEYRDIEWIYDKNTIGWPASAIKTHNHFFELWNTNAIKGLLYKECMKMIEDFPVEMENQSVRVADCLSDYKKNRHQVLLGEGKSIITKNYIKILDLPMSDTDKVKKEKYHLKQMSKLERNQ